MILPVRRPIVWSRTAQLDKQIPEARPGFTCSASITTATRKQVLSVPIQAMAAREVVLDAKGQIVREPRDPKAKRRSARRRMLRRRRRPS